MPNVRVCLLGTRGSIPVHGPQVKRYGGASSCVLVRMGEETILLDAGSGLMAAEGLIAPQGRLTFLLSHAHVDHIIGLPMFGPMFSPAYTVDVYAGEHVGYDARGQITLLMQPPLWPCGPEVFHAGVAFHRLPAEEFAIGDVRVRWTKGSHPGGCTIYRLSCGGTSLVYATDFEHGPQESQALIEFAKGCDLLIYDAQYAPEEYPAKKGFGHSTWAEGVRIGTACDAKRILLTHHDPHRDDATLDRLNDAIARECPRCSFARGGEEITL